MGQLKPDLRQTAKLWRQFLYSKIMNIFEYENVPEEIDLQSLKLFLFYRGKIVFYKVKDKYIIQPFDYTDRLNWYYIPSNGRVVNPWLPIGFQNWEFVVEDEAIIYNSTPDIRRFDKFSIVADLIYKTANQLAENDISYYCIQRNHRLIAIFTAENDLQKAEANRILDKMYEGCSDITMQEDLVSHIKVNPITMNSTRSSITELIEFQQYVLANFYHSFGINSNYNLKREQLNSNEIDVNKEVLRLNIDDMLRCRELGVSKINDKFGLDIRVHLNEEVYKALLEGDVLLGERDGDEDTGVSGDIQEYDGENSGDITAEGTSPRENTEGDVGIGLQSASDEEQKSQIETKDAEETSDKTSEEDSSEVQITIETPTETIEIDAPAEITPENASKETSESEGKEDDTEKSNSE